MQHVFKYLNRWFVHWQYLIVICQFAIVNGSCTKAPIHQRDTVEEVGLIHVLPNQSTHTLPGMNYYFYPVGADGSSPTLANCDGQGNYSGYLATGHYEALAVNPNATNVYLKGMDKLQTATAGAQVVTRTAGTRALTYELHEPGMLYSLLTQRFEAISDQEITLRPIPELLTRSVIIRFALDETLLQEVTAIDGILRGVYPEINLATGQAQAGSVQDITQAGMLFGTNPADTGYETTLTLFGIANPKQGTNYENNLTATLTLAGGETETIDIDMTNTLTEVIEENQGVIPLELPLNINVKKTLVGIKATVEPWRDSGDSEKEL